MSDDEQHDDQPASLMFKVENATGKMTSLNTRKEMHGEDQVLAVDLKLQVNVPIAVAEALLGTNDGESSGFLEQLYNDEDELLYWAIGKVTFSTDFEDCDVQVSRKKIKGAKLSKFSCHPESGRRCELTFNASYRPESSDLEQLAELLMREVKISAHLPPDLFD